MNRLIYPGLTPVASSIGFNSVALHEPNTEDEEELETLLQEVVIETQDLEPVLNEKKMEQLLYAVQNFRSFV